MVASPLKLVVVCTAAVTMGFSSARTTARTSDGPTDEERAARAAFIYSHPELPASIKGQLRRFETRPQDVLRRIDFLRAHQGLSSLRRDLIRHGHVRVEMRTVEVRASWGEPEKVDRQGETETWAYSAYSSRGLDRSTRLRFIRGTLVKLSLD